MGSEWKVENSSKCIAPGIIHCLRTVISEIPEFRAITTTTIRFKQSHFRHTIKLTKHTNDVVHLKYKSDSTIHYVTFVITVSANDMTTCAQLSTTSIVLPHMIKWGIKQYL